MAVVQAGSVLFDAGRTLDKLERPAEQAAADGARLIVFPEAFVGGCPKGLDFGARVGSRRPRGPDDFVRYFPGAMQLPGPGCRRLEELAARLDCWLVIGVIERAGGTFYCTVVFVGPDHGVVARHRKPMPTAGDRATWVPSMQDVALEGACFVPSACQVPRRSDCPEDYDVPPASDPAAVPMRGGSCVVDRFGQVPAGPGFGEEVIVLADPDPGGIARRKYDFDVVGHHARPDVFRLSVDSTPRSPAAIRAESA